VLRDEEQRIANSSVLFLFLTEAMLWLITFHMERVPYSVSELAFCIAGQASQKRRDLCLRRLRHWGSAGVLETTGALHVGTGRTRQFESEQAYVAAVLLRLADWGLPIGALKAVAEALAFTRTRDRNTEELWDEAKQLQNPFKIGCVFIGLSVKLDDEEEKPVSVGMVLQRGMGIISPSFYLDREDSIIVMNLTEIFSGVKLI
jgi:hypothetical protein